MPPQAFALGFTVYTLWNAINDPVAGAISDRTQTRFGKRIPYILFGTLPLVIFFFLVWSSPFQGDDPRLFWYFLGVICLYDGFYTFVTINQTVLFQEMFLTLKERTEVSNYRQIFGILGLILGVALPPMLYTHLGWGPMGFLLGSISVIFFYLSLFVSFEREEFSNEKPVHLISHLKTTATNRSFNTFVTAYFLMQYALSLIMAAIPFYAKYVLQIQGDLTTFLLLAVFLVTFPMLTLWKSVTLKVGTRQALMLTLGILSFTLLPFLWIKGFYSALIATASVGIGLAGILLLTDVFLSEIIDEDEVNTGTRTPGIYFGASQFLGRLSGIVQTQTLNGILAFSGYNAYLNISEQSENVSQAIRWLLTGFPVFALVLAIAALFFYPLHGKYLNLVQKKIDRLHKQKSTT